MKPPTQPLSTFFLHTLLYNIKYLMLLLLLFCPGTELSLLLKFITAYNITSAALNGQKKLVGIS